MSFSTQLATIMQYYFPQYKLVGMVKKKIKGGEEENGDG
jgi:hypothetical protein